MKAAAKQAGRDIRDIQLIAVSKTQNVDKILAAIDAGQRIFAENRVQESLVKWPALKSTHPNISLHLIGPLQTNKIKQALSLFDVIETVDRPKLAEALAKEMKASQPFPECYIQVNIGEEPQKSGILPTESDDFITYCKNELKLPITGLMCIPPADIDPAPYFTRLATQAKKHRLHNISMGMSGDFEAAIAQGATHIRVGQAVFGERG